MKALFGFMNCLTKVSVHSFKKCLIHCSCYISNNFLFHKCPADILIYFLVVASVKTGFYYAMKNNNGTVADLRRRLLQIVNHYQVCLISTVDHSLLVRITSLMHIHYV